MKDLTLYERKSSEDYSDAPILKGLYYNPRIRSFEWLTSTRCGNCKKLATALKKLNIKEDDLYKQSTPDFKKYMDLISAAG